MKQLQDYLQDQKDQMIEFTKRIINIDSHPDDVQGVQKVADVLKAQMKALGMTTRQIDEGKPGTVLIGELAGTHHQAPLVLLGHMDTVFLKGTAAKHPFKIDGNKMTGPGIFDMKPGLTIGLFAIQALKKFNLIQRPVKMIIVSDEEKLHMHSNAYNVIANECQGGAFGINLEGSRDRSAVGTHNRGGMIPDIIVHGVAAHSGADPEKGRSAILELAHQIIKLSALTNLQAGVHVNCGTITGGVSENIIPDYAKTSLGVRFRTNEQRDKLLQEIKSIAAHPTIAGTTTEVNVRTKIDSMEATPEVQNLFKQLQKVAMDTGYGELKAVGGGGASDAGIMVSNGVPTIDAMGVVGDGAHSSKEHADAQSMVDRSGLIANFYCYYANK